jgi:hypothetical protein
MLNFKIFCKNNISFLNLVFLIIFTLYIIKRSFSTDIIWWYDLALYHDQNKIIFQDYFCHVFNFGIIPFHYFSKIFGFKFSVYLFTFILGHFYAYFLSLILKNYFAIKGFFEIYLINFFFFIPFSIGVFYLDQLAILFILLTLFFFTKKKQINLIFSSLFLTISFFIKFYYIIPYIVFCILLFIISFLTKNFILIKKLLLQFLFCILFFLVFLFLFKLNFSNIDIFYDYMFNNNEKFTKGRFDKFFIKILFLQYNPFSIIKNFNMGSMFLYPFIVSYYFGIFLIVVKVFKLKINYTLINEFKLMILLFFTVSAPIYFIIAGRDWNHKLYFMVPLFLIVVDKLFLFFKNKNLNLSNYKKLIFFFLILYSLVPLNERYDLKSSIFSNNATGREEIVLNNKYSDFLFFTKSSYLGNNNVKNIDFQKKQAADFIIKNNFNNLPIFSIDEPSKLIKLHLNSQTCDIGCYNYLGHNPPNTDKSLKKYLKLFDNQIKKNAIIIICKVNDDHFCLRSSDIYNKSVPTSKNNDIIKQILLLMKQNNFIEIYNTENFFIYKN